MSRLTESVRHAYQAFAEDPQLVWDRLDDDVVFHISGEHPLSGEYAGLAEVRRYVDAVNEATGGRGGFSVASAFTDDSGTEMLVEGTAFHGDGPYIRTVVHRLKLSGGRIVEFRDHPFDQQSEDRFWSSRVPAQRDGEQADADLAEISPSATIPTQPTSDHVASS
jgi:ketosteroid isomerase-like protein